jgi:hypothetical protein
MCRWRLEPSLIVLLALFVSAAYLTDRAAIPHAVVIEFRP